MTDHIYMVIYTTWISADFGSEPITTRAGPFKDEKTANYWIENNQEEYSENLHGYPDPQVQKHPIRDIEDLE